MEARHSSLSQKEYVSDMKTLFTVETSTGALQMTSSVNSLVEYFKYLHLFGETFGLHLNKEIPLAIESNRETSASNRETSVRLSV